MFTCTKREAFISVLFLLLTFFVFIATYHRDSFSDSFVPMKYVVSQDLKKGSVPKSCPGMEQLYADRIRLSKMLNSFKQNFSRQSCEMLQLQTAAGKPVNSRVSASGGWCKEASTSTGGSHVNDRSLAEEMSFFLKGKYVASFGDGPGDYKRYMDSTKRLKVYDAYDGAPYGKETSGGIVEFLDLTAPQYGLPLYDWVISLEVAEHIPSEYESIYVDNVARHAKEGIILSWAVPGQGGLSHVNNRPLEYVKNILLVRGFKHDPQGSERLKNAATLSWLRSNTNVYRRLPSHPANPKDV